MVSVPSRGNGVIDLRYRSWNDQQTGQFPSPLGEMGLSIWLLVASTCPARR